MTRNRPDRCIDCILLKREAQKRIYAEIAGLSPADEIRYFEEKSRNGPFADWLREVEEHQRSASRTG